jgi:hypothetical protein
VNAWNSNGACCRNPELAIGVMPAFDLSNAGQMPSFAASYGKQGFHFHARFPFNGSGTG